MTRTRHLDSIEGGGQAEDCHKHPFARLNCLIRLRLPSETFNVSSFRHAALCTISCRHRCWGMISVADIFSLRDLTRISLIPIGFPCKLGRSSDAAELTLRCHSFKMNLFGRFAEDFAVWTGRAYVALSGWSCRGCWPPSRPRSRKCTSQDVLE